MLQSDEPVILVADDLTPSKTVQLDREKILAFITMGGSSNSHTAILARMMNIPAVVGAGTLTQEDCDGKGGIVDGFANIRSVADVASALQNDASGIGLSRSESSFTCKPVIT